MAKKRSASENSLKLALQADYKELETNLIWLKKNLPPGFINQIDPESLLLIGKKLSQVGSNEPFWTIDLGFYGIGVAQANPSLDTKVIEQFSHRLIYEYEIVPFSQKKLFLFSFLGKEKTKSSLKTEDVATSVKKKGAAVEINLTWRFGTKLSLLERAARVLKQSDLTLHKATLCYLHSPQPETETTLTLYLQSKKTVDLDEIISELSLINFFDPNDLIQKEFVDTKRLSGMKAHLVRNLASFTHQALVYLDPNLYSKEYVTEALIRHADLTALICKAFETKFHPKKKQLRQYEQICEETVHAIKQIDTGISINDQRRKNILQTALLTVAATLKTNFYSKQKSAFAFRLDPIYLRKLPYDTTSKFPEIPFGIFFIRGMHFIGFNIRFRDLARGGVRTVIPPKWENYTQERNTIFQEAYNLALTQQKKNKDIPEGGAKTAILLAPLDVFSKEEKLYQQMIEKLPFSEREKKLEEYRYELKKSYLFESQKSFIKSLLALVDGKIEVDYWKKPEYLYLGPDENMMNEMIDWIAAYAQSVGYRPGSSFMSSKLKTGINHKQYGVTSYGVCVYMKEVLLALGIDPKIDPFTVKISGGPDGDVAGNVIHILAQRYPKTAKLIALTDVSGTIYDPQGLDWKELDHLFLSGKSIRFYPIEKLHSSGFLLDLQTKNEKKQTAYFVKENGKLKKQWLSSNETNQLYRNNVHNVKVDIFIPGGGRPRTLNESNIQSFLDPDHIPTAKAIVEGANLYLTPKARRFLEEKGVIILKDSSCNKGGVITSSFEVLAGLILTEQEFIQHKEEYVKEVLAIIAKAAEREANLILQTHAKTGHFYTDISDLISERINLYKDELLTYLEYRPWKKNDSNPFLQSVFQYCPPLLRGQFAKKILNLPEIHQKAIAAVFLASRLVYLKGLDWAPSITLIAEQLARDTTLL